MTDSIQVCCGQAVVRCYQHRAAAAYAITASASQTWSWCWRKSNCVNPSSRGVVNGRWSGTRQLDTIRIGSAASFAEVSDSSDVSCRRAVLVSRRRFSDRGQRRLHHQPADLRSFGHFVRQISRCDFEEARICFGERVALLECQAKTLGRNGWIDDTRRQTIPRERLHRARCGVDDRLVRTNRSPSPKQIEDDWEAAHK